MMAIKRRRNLLDNVLAGSVSEICVLDADRRVRYFSAGMEKTTGWKASDIEGLLCNLPVSPGSSSIELLTSGLAPTSEIMDGRAVSVESVLPRKAGSAWKTTLTFLPILDENNQVVRILISANTSGDLKPTKESITQKLHAEITAIRLKTRRKFSQATLLGQNSQMLKALGQADLLQHGHGGYQIMGPSGSGRRHLARMIHVAGEHSEHSFAQVECRLLTLHSMQETIRTLQHQTGDQSRTAHRRTGTLALLDVEYCPREIQSWLVDSLSQNPDRPRIVGIGTQELQTVVTDGWMMPEFQELLSTVSIQLPALHHRGDDVDLLAQHFVEESQRMQQTSAESISPEVLSLFRFYRWPGNVRELRQVVFAACEACFEKAILKEHLPFAFRTGLDAQKMPHTADQKQQPLEDMLERFETEMIQKTLEACSGNKADAARRLGMTRPRFYRRLKTLGLDESAED